MAYPSASLTALAGDTDPPPLTTVKFTVSPSAGFWPMKTRTWICTAYIPSPAGVTVPPLCISIETVPEVLVLPPLPIDTGGCVSMGGSDVGASLHAPSAATSRIAGRV